MPKILAIAASYFYLDDIAIYTQCLKLLGYDVTETDIATVQSRGGKNYINQFDAAIWFEWRTATSTSTTGDAINSYLAYSPGDKPIICLGGQVRGSTPTDFPILAFNQADTSTYYQLESNLYAIDSKYIGVCAINSEGYRIWGKFANYVYPNTPTDYATYMCDPAKLDANREILWRVDASRTGYSSVPSNHALAVRYYNRYFLPIMGSSPSTSWSARPDVRSKRRWALPLLLWVLKREGILPLQKYRIPFCVENDHLMEYGSVYCPVTDYYQRQKTAMLSWQWLLHQLRLRGIGILIGVYTTHYQSGQGVMSLLQYNDTSVATVLGMVRSSDPWLVYTCWHDHVCDLGTTGVSYTRHAGGQYGSPVPVSDPDCPFGSGATATINLWSRVPLLVHAEGNIKEMQEVLGLRYAWGEPHKCINFATNSSGGRGMISLLGRLFGIRGVRVLFNSATTTSGQGTSYPAPWYGSTAYLAEVDGVELLDCDDLHIGSYRGLYNPGSGGDDQDINQRYSLGASDATSTYRRFIAGQVSSWFGSLFELGVRYIHTSPVHPANPSSPLSRFYETGNFNAWVELFSEFFAITDLLPEFVQGGTHSDLLAFRRFTRERFRQGIGLSRVNI